jgi:hypothetical protein
VICLGLINESKDGTLGGALNDAMAQVEQVLPWTARPIDRGPNLRNPTRSNTIACSIDTTT